MSRILEMISGKRCLPDRGIPELEPGDTELSRGTPDCCDADLQSAEREAELVCDVQPS